MTMENSNKQIAIIAQSVAATIPSTPTWLMLRNRTVDGGIDSAFSESDERSANRQLAATFKGNQTVRKRLEVPLIHDAAQHLLFESLFDAQFSANVLKVGQTQRIFAIEELWENGVTDPYRRTVDCIASDCTISMPVSGAGSLSFGCVALSEADDTASIAGATYTAAATGNPMVAADAIVNDAFGLSTPARMISANIQITSTIRERFGWGSRTPFSLALGRWRVNATLEFYFEAPGQYTALKANPTGAVDFTFGDTAGQKYRLLLPNARAVSPMITDGSNDTDATIRVTASGMYGVSDATSFKLTKAV